MVIKKKKKKPLSGIEFIFTYAALTFANIHFTNYIHKRIYKRGQVEVKKPTGDRKPNLSIYFYFYYLRISKRAL